MNTKIKTEIAIGIILLVAIIVAGIIWVSGIKQEQAQINVSMVKENTSTPVATQTMPTQIVSQVDTANWQTHQDKKDGFEFKYPKDFQASSTINGVSLDPVTKGLEVPFLTMEIKTDSHTSLTNNSLKRLTDEKHYNDVINKEILIGGLEAKEIGNSGEKGFVKSTYREIFIEKSTNETVFIKAVNFNDNILESVLSTFKFIK